MMNNLTVFDNSFSNVPEWEKDKTYYEFDIVSYQGESYEAIRNIETSEDAPDSCVDYRILKKGIREV